VTFYANNLDANKQLLKTVRDSDEYLKHVNIGEELTFVKFRKKKKRKKTNKKRIKTCNTISRKINQKVSIVLAVLPLFVNGL
jgi:hypothetical protein